MIEGLLPTARQIEILELVAQGLGNDEIAEVLNISTKTVNHHCEDTRMKMFVRDRLPMVLEAIDLGYINLKDVTGDYLGEPSLNKKELQAMNCLTFFHFGAEVTTTMIANRYRKSPKTISNQLQSAYRKLGVKANQVEHPQILACVRFLASEVRQHKEYEANLRVRLALAA